jgi:hypothetical protein
MFITSICDLFTDSLVKTAVRTPENMAQFRYLGMTVTNQNLILEKIREEIEFG